MTLDEFLEINKVERIPFHTSYHNGTGYFDLAFSQSNQYFSEGIRMFTDDYDRKALILKCNESCGMIIHHRYPNDTDIVVITQTGFNYSHDPLAIQQLLNTPLESLQNIVSLGREALKAHADVCFAV